MNREESRALRDAIDTVLNWPPAVRIKIAAWLAPEASKPGAGRDPHPPPIAGSDLEPLATVAGSSPRRSPAPRPAKVRQSVPFNMKAAEQRLLTALRESPGLSLAALANAPSSSRTRTGERLRGLAARGAIEKNPEGRWRLKREAQHPSTDPKGALPDPPPPPSP